MAKTLGIMKVLYVDVYISGHHVDYSRNIVSRLVRKKCEVTILTTTTALDAVGYKNFLATLPELVSVHRVIDVGSINRALPQAVRTWLALRSAFDVLKNDYGESYGVVFLPNVSGIYQAFGLLGSPFGKARIVGMLVSIRYHLARLGLAKAGGLKDVLLEALFFRFLRNINLTRLITIDPFLLSDKKTTSYKFSQKIKFLEHPFTCLPLANRRFSRARLGVKEKSVVVLVFGALSRRKAVDTLIAAAANDALNGRITVVVGGTPDKAVIETLASKNAQYLRSNGLLIERLEFVSEVEESELFAAADIVWVAYRNFYDTSGVLLSAYVNAKAVIGCDRGYINWSINNDKTGLVVDPNLPHEVVSALLQLVSSDGSRELYGDRGKNIAKSRDPERFFAAIVEDIVDACSGYDANIS